MSRYHCIDNIRRLFELYQERYCNQEKDEHSSAYKVYNKNKYKHYKETKASKMYTCFICHKQGHKANECWHNPENNGKTMVKQTSQPGPSGYKTNTPNKYQKSTFVKEENASEFAKLVKERKNLEQLWILDSGASSHMTSHFEYLEEPQDDKRKIILADNSYIKSQFSGNGAALLNNDNTTKTQDYSLIEIFENDNSEETFPLQEQEDVAESQEENLISPNQTSPRYNLRPIVRDQIYYELSSDEEPIYDNKDKDPTKEPDEEAFKLGARQHKEQDVLKPFSQKVKYLLFSEYVKVKYSNRFKTFSPLREVLISTPSCVLLVISPVKILPFRPKRLRHQPPQVTNPTPNNIYSRASIIRIPIIRNISYPKANPKPKPLKPKANIAGFPAGTWRQAPFILPTMSSKRKRVVLSFTDKLKILGNMDGNVTSTDLKKNSDAITNYASAYTWLMQLCSQGQPIRGTLISEMALEMNDKIGVNPDFEATTGWHMRFKSRHGIRQLDIQCEKLSANTEAAKHFKESFINMIDKEVYNKINV
ncbi:hypothetical protein LAZ67_3002687 [Cordylochernes scorpioides]|uniref:HTH CENPB-type domain-containing protein n=1 Tax=Cordylochernes scorpioides TaxID=51811 RepID=A0ABY6KCP5_9ARAC|nr:hypothetical protein LAZ67_3002687 [Cordylochernes scorpioides]